MSDCVGAFVRQVEVRVRVADAALEPQRTRAATTMNCKSVSLYVPSRAARERERPLSKGCGALADVLVRSGHASGLVPDAKTPPACITAGTMAGALACWLAVGYAAAAKDH